MEFVHLNNTTAPPGTHDAGHAPLASALSVGAQLFVFSGRQWLMTDRSTSCVNDALQPFYDRYNAGSALLLLDELMSQLNVTACRPVIIHCPCRARLGEDELLLVQTLQCVQRGDAPGAANMLAPVFAGTFATTFLRIASSYVAELLAADLSLTGVRYLSAVPDVARAAPAGAV